MVEAAFQQEVARRGGRVLALEKYPLDPGKMAEPIRRVAQAAGRVDSIFIPTAPTRCRKSSPVSPPPASIPSACNCSAPDCGTIRASSQTAALDGGWYAAPESTGFRNFSGRYRARYGQDPVRTATLAYDAVALVAALVKTQGAQRFSEQILTTLGLCRHRRRIPLPHRRHQRARAVRAAGRAPGGQVVSPAPRAFNPGT